MKKLLYLTAAILALAACSKVTQAGLDEAQREVSFQVANYVQTKAESAGKYSTDVPFGTYAWLYTSTTADATEGADAAPAATTTVTEWMINETVGFVGGVWKTTAHPYYWPKTGSADFISYSPFAGTANKVPVAPAANQGETNGQTAGNAAVAGQETVTPPEPVITRVVGQDESVTYTFEYGKYAPYRVNGSAFDLMYADWKNVHGNVNEITDDADDQRDSGYKGVPTLFHHALARIGFQIRANFTEWPLEDETDEQGNVLVPAGATKWEVTLQRAKLLYVKHSGSLKLTLDGDRKWTTPGWVWTPLAETEDIVFYELPEQGAGEDGGNQDPTTGDGQETEQETHAPGYPLSTEWYNLRPEDYNLPEDEFEFFVLPQELQVPNGYSPALELMIHIKTTLSNGKVITERFDPMVSLAYLMAENGLEKKWKMNQRIIYRISIKPTANVDTPDNPSDVALYFDTAAESWVNDEVATEIEL